MRCFSKLPNRENPVALIPNVGFLLRFERECQHSCAPLAQHRFNGRFGFNRKLREGAYVFEGKVLEDLNAWHAQVDADTKDFVERCLAVHNFFPELNGIGWKDFPAAIDAARRKTASEAEFVRKIYASFLGEEASADAPPPHVLSSDWAWFRWVQCQILAALRIFKRYNGRFPENPGTDFWRRAEHSMHDAYYVILGSLAGALATLDTEIREDFLLLCPDAVMLSPNVLSMSRG